MKCAYGTSGPRWTNVAVSGISTRWSVFQKVRRSCPVSERLSKFLVDQYEDEEFSPEHRARLVALAGLESPPPQEPDIGELPPRE